MRKGAVIAMAGCAVVAIAAAVVVVQLREHGLSARDDPTLVEAIAARAMRHLALPAAERQRTNPIALDPAGLADARSHFADHCALCHGNDGRGQTSIGKNLYPKVPDMTLPQTQQLTDGELFSVITNGVRLTGMPAWGERTPLDDKESWLLVALIRHLTELTPEQIEEMKELNPKSRAELQQEEAEKVFLEGRDPISRSAGP